MSKDDDSSGALDKLIAQLTGPLDWLGAIAGGVAGSIVSIHVGGLDFGHSILVGAGSGVTASKTAKLALRRLSINKKAQRFSKLLKEAGGEDLAADLEVYRKQWKAKVLSNDDFEKSIEIIRRKLTKRQLKGVSIDNGGF